MTETRSTASAHSSAEDSASRGEATRGALVRAGIELFGRQGYHATGNRALAEAAGVNAALIGYHFGGKRGLYLAAFEAIAARMRQKLGPAAESVEAGLEEGREPLPLLHHLLDGFVAMMASDESGPWARLIIREQMDPSEALDILYEGILGKVLALATRLVLQIREPSDTGARHGQEVPTERRTSARLTALTIMGQGMIFRVARATAMRHLEWDTIGPDELALIQRRVRENSTAILGNPPSSRKERSP